MPERERSVTDERGDANESDGATDEIPQRLRTTFDVDDTIVSTYGEAEHAGMTVRERRSLWRTASGLPKREAEYLVPRIMRSIRRERPPYMVDPQDRKSRSRDELLAEVRSLAPWSVPFRLAHGLTTMDDHPRRRMRTARRLAFRRDLINGTVADLLGAELPQTTVLDIGCYCGYFSLDLATRGTRHVHGVDLRPENIAQARFVAGHFGIDNADFEVADGTAFEPGRTWDVVLNLGVLYHVTDPVAFLRRTYELCRRFAVIDTQCYPEPVSALVFEANESIERRTLGREPLEFVPTYRATIDLLRYAGFSEVYEVVGVVDNPPEEYGNARRRCFLAMK